MGAVYEVEHAGLQKRCALKVLRPEVAEDPSVAARLQREGMTAGRLRHRNVVDIYDIDALDGVHFLVMEYLEGEEFSTYLEREGPLSPATALDLLLPVLDAVEAAHRSGIIHRDLKPSNIFLERDVHGTIQPKVLDFGIARSFEQGNGHEPPLTASGVLLGTPRYMSPEQVAGKSELGPATDQYSLGVILYESLIGASPFGPAGMYGLMLKIGQGELIPPREAKPDLPENLASIILRAMAVDPGDRFETLRGMAKALLPFASSTAEAWWRSALENPNPSDSGRSPPSLSVKKPVSVPRAQAEGSKEASVPDDMPLIGPPSHPRTLDSVGFAATRIRPEEGRSKPAPAINAAPVRTLGWTKAGSRIGLAALGLGVGLGAALVVAALVRPSSTFLGTQPTATPAATTPLVERFRISAEPPEAFITLDNHEPVIGELRGTFRPGEATHRVVVAFEGYVTQVITFRNRPPAEKVVLQPARDR